MTEEEIKQLKAEMLDELVDQSYRILHGMPAKDVKRAVNPEREMRRIMRI